MDRMLVAGVLALIVAGGVVPFTDAAQDELDALSPEVGRFVPPAEALGEGWTMLFAEDPGASPQIFRAVARVVYGGPAGARVVFFAWTITGDDASIPTWQATSSLMDELRIGRAPDVEGIDQVRVQAITPPVGCFPVKWAEGVDFRTEFVAGLTLCAADPDVLLLAAVSGDLGGRRGAEASNRLIEQALAVGGRAATPVAAAS